MDKHHDNAQNQPVKSHDRRRQNKEKPDQPRRYRHVKSRGRKAGNRRQRDDDNHGWGDDAGLYGGLADDKRSDYGNSGADNSRKPDTRLPENLKGHFHRQRFNHGRERHRLPLGRDDNQQLRRNHFLVKGRRRHINPRRHQ